MVRKAYGPEHRRCLHTAHMAAYTCFLSLLQLAEILRRIKKRASRERKLRAISRQARYQAFRNGSIFGQIELPNINPAVVTNITVFLVRSLLFYIYIFIYFKNLNKICIVIWQVNY